MWWLEHGVPPQVADEMPMERAFWLRQVVKAKQNAEITLRQSVE